MPPVRLNPNGFDLARTHMSGKEYVIMRVLTANLGAFDIPLRADHAATLGQALAGGC